MYGMHMLRLMCEKVHKNKIENERTRVFRGRTPVEDKGQGETTSIVQSYYEEIIHSANNKMLRYAN